MSDYTRTLAAYLEPPPTSAKQAVTLSRRKLLQVSAGAGGGLMLSFLLPRQTNANTADTFAPNAYLSIGTDNTITLISKNPEIGQGIKTAFGMILAEELDADWSNVTVEQAATDADTYGRQFAGGSMSVRLNWETLRRAGATGRTMLVTAAAQQWGVNADDCSTEPGFVLHAASGRKVAYGDVAALAATLPVPDPSTVQLKHSDQYRLLGRRITGVDNYALVTGQPLFGIDQVVDNLRYATYVKCPATGGRVKSANLNAVKALSGVIDAFVLEGNNNVQQLMPGVAIVADSTWAAIKARRSLEVEWDETDACCDDSEDFERKARELSAHPGKTDIVEQGNSQRAIADANIQLEAFYSYPFLSHASLEPQNCTAWFHDGQIELWAPTQTPGRGESNVAELLDLAESQVTVHTTRIGGGFGRRLINDWMCEAAAISKHVGQPVKLQWTREDDMAHDFYRVAGFHSLKGAVDDSGNLTGWEDHLISFASDEGRPVAGGGIRPTEFPAPLVENTRVTQTLMPLKVPTGPWRAPGSNGIAFAVQCFIHELAMAADRDHLDFLLDIMGKPQWLEPDNVNALNTGRAAGVIRHAAQAAGWGRELPANKGLGLAFHFSHAGHIAEVAEVTVKGRTVTVDKVTVAADVGSIVNLSGAENQCQGAVIDGISAMAGQKLNVNKGRIQEANFDQYPMLRMSQAPQVDVHFIASDYAPTGLGEPALPPVAPAVCNAIFAASGIRIRELPLLSSDVRLA
jgi:isoquinoline 1-oxidoreductase beta subunit